MTTLPMMCAIRRKLPEGEPVDIEARLQSAWQKKAVGEKVAGKRIAIGSRGVAEIPTIARRPGRVWALLRPAARVYVQAKQRLH